MENKNDTYEPLEELLESTGLKYNYIAEKMGVTYDALLRWRKSPNSLTLDKVVQLGKVTGLGTQAILNVMHEFPYEVK